MATLFQTIMAISAASSAGWSMRGRGPRLRRLSGRPPRPGAGGKPRVVYQGEPGCYSEEAAAGFFGPQVNSRGAAWFGDVFLALQNGEADYAVLPVENTSTGSIRQVYDLLAQYARHRGRVAGEGGSLPGRPPRRDDGRDSDRLLPTSRVSSSATASWTAGGAGRGSPPWTPPAPPSRWPPPGTAPPPLSAPSGPPGSTGLRFWRRR